MANSPTVAFFLKENVVKNVVNIQISLVVVFFSVLEYQGLNPGTAELFLFSDRILLNS